MMFLIHFLQTSLLDFAGPLCPAFFQAGPAAKVCRPLFPLPASSPKSRTMLPEGKPMSDPITVVTIAGSGRSGSTILSLLLSQDATVFNLGQMRDIWAAWNDDAPCSCDHTLRNCPVYGTAVPRALARAGITDAQEAAHLGYAFFKAATRLRDWGDEVLRAELAARHAPYLAALQYLLLDIARETGAHAFIEDRKSVV